MSFWGRSRLLQARNGESYPESRCQKVCRPSCWRSGCTSSSRRMRGWGTSRQGSARRGAPSRTSCTWPRPTSTRVPRSPKIARSKAADAELRVPAHLPPQVTLSQLPPRQRASYTRRHAALRHNLGSPPRVARPPRPKVVLPPLPHRDRSRSAAVPPLSGRDHIHLGGRTVSAQPATLLADRG